MESRRSLTEWEFIVDGLYDQLEDVLSLIEQEQQAGVRADIRALNAFDELERYMVTVKQELGI